MQDLRVAEIRALSDLGAGTFLEIAGKLVMRHGRRLYDHANHPDPMMDVDEASVRFHAPGSSTQWQPAAGLSVNRDQLVLLAPLDSADSAVPYIRGRGRDVVVNLICGPLQVAGNVSVPFDSTLAGYLHQSPTRFLAVSTPTIRPHRQGASLGDFQDTVPMCFVNATKIDACLESR